MLRVATKGSEEVVISVVVADDHPIILTGLRTLIMLENDIRLDGEATDGDIALELITNLEPDIAILDIEMPKKSGFDILRLLQRKSIPTRTIVLTLYDEQEIFEYAMRLGARGYIKKDSAPIDVVRGIRRVMEGDYFLSPSVADIQSDSSALENIEALTRMERRILKLIAEEKSTKEIATDLCISPRTVDHHRSNICQKVGISGHFALVWYAFQHKIIL